MSTYRQALSRKEQDKQTIHRQERKQTKDAVSSSRDLWRECGPVWFAENVLTSPTDTPPHPDYDPDNNPPIFCEGCEREHPKFREGGLPYHIMLANYQKEYLMDKWRGVIPLSLITASRGAGKTFVLAIWCCWKLATEDRYSITYMGGSLNQSKVAQGYIDDWRYDVPLLFTIIDKSLKGIDRYATTIWRGKITFSACSPTAARGPHVNEVNLDEAATAEDKSEEGSLAIKAAMWQITGKRASSLTLASTCHFIGGMFYEYMSHPEQYGFKVYQWAIAKHTSGKLAKEVYTDKEPTHWIPNVWWLTEKEIRQFRRTKSDEEFLTEALGGASMASGAVFKKEDLDIVICKVCSECEPYTKNCPLSQVMKLGTVEDPLKYVGERRIGFDYGVSEAPCAITIIGRKEGIVYVLFNEEQVGLREEEKRDWILETCQKYDTWDFIPDPAVSGAHLNEILMDKGYSVVTIAESDKLERVYNLMNFVENHKLIVPQLFWYLSDSLRKTAWDSDGKIRKVGDHSFDSLCYALNDFVVGEESDVLSEFLKMEKKPKSDEIWGVKG